MNQTKLFILSSVALVSLASAQQDQPAAVSQPTIPKAPEQTPGQCHALVNVPAKLASVVQDVVSQEAGERLEVIPAEYKWVEKEIAISEAETTYEVIPATYKIVEETIVVEPKRVEYEVIPAQYKDVEEKVIVKPAMREWRKSRGGAASLSGEVMRLIEVPPKYQTITKKVLVEGPSTRAIVKEAETAVIKKKVIDTPARANEIIIPAEYKKIRVKELVSDVDQKRTPIKEKLQKITKQEVTHEAQLKWQRVPCDSDLNDTNVKAIQRGLRAAGYDVRADGKFGKGSQQALEKFQEAKGLAKGAITIETMKALGVDID